MNHEEAGSVGLMGSHSLFHGRNLHDERFSRLAWRGLTSVVGQGSENQEIKKCGLGLTG